MKILLPCMQCFKEGFPNVNYSDVEIRDDGVYEMTCDKGHASITFIQEHKFEVLFDMGAMALIDGYVREAVSSLAASLERFYEYCIEVMTTHNGIDHNSFKKTWKHVSNQSERQLGAFYILYLNLFKEEPEVINRFRVGNTDLVAFRNKVIHKGHIPKHRDVVEYGNHLYKYMTTILIKLRTNCKGAVDSTFIERQRSLYKGREERLEPLSVMTIPSIIGMVLDDELFGKSSFDESLEDLKGRMKMLYSK